MAYIQASVMETLKQQASKSHTLSRVDTQYIQQYSSVHKYQVFCILSSRVYFHSPWSKNKTVHWGIYWPGIVFFLYIRGMELFPSELNLNHCTLIVSLHAIPHLGNGHLHRGKMKWNTRRFDVINTHLWQNHMTRSLIMILCARITQPFFQWRPQYYDIHPWLQCRAFFVENFQILN